jgi:hypothetical protein
MVQQVLAFADGKKKTAFSVRDSRFGNSQFKKCFVRGIVGT